MVSYDIEMHTECNRTLQQLDHDLRERITDTLLEMSENREISSHPNVDSLDGWDFYKVRVKNHRILVERDGRKLRVVMLDKRSRVYDRLETAQQRANS
jgi:mRNA-degrading endonuclease RelE of RelBE toxin-antitoxin system